VKARWAILLTGQFLGETMSIADSIEDEIARIVPLRRGTAPELPTGIEHSPDVDDVGRLSSEALAMSYESAAKHIEEMGKNLIDEIKSCEVIALDIVKELERVKGHTAEVVNECKQLAEDYRGEARKLFAHVQNRALLADKVRKLCIDMSGDIKK
jgi:hypothetical protein